METQLVNPGDDVPVAPDKPTSGFGLSNFSFAGQDEPTGANLFGSDMFYAPLTPKPPNKERVGPYIDPEWARNNPDKANSLILDEQFRDFKERYRPLEQDALRQAQDFDFTEEARRSGALVAAQFDNNKGMTTRSLSRYGIRPTSRQLDVSEDARQRNRALGVVDAENTTRSQLYDRNMSAIGDLSSQGQGIASQAMEGMGRASALNRQNEEANDALERQHTAGVVGGVMSGAALGFTAGGPVGAAAGALIGGAMGSI